MIQTSIYRLENSHTTFEIISIHHTCTSSLIGYYCCNHVHNPDISTLTMLHSDLPSCASKKLLIGNGDLHTNAGMQQLPITDLQRPANIQESPHQQPPGRRGNQPLQHQPTNQRPAKVSPLTPPKRILPIPFKTTYITSAPGSQQHKSHIQLTQHQCMSTKRTGPGSSRQPSPHQNTQDGQQPTTRHQTRLAEAMQDRAQQPLQHASPKPTSESPQRPPPPTNQD